MKLTEREVKKHALQRLERQLEEQKFNQVDGKPTVAQMRSAMRILGAIVKLENELKNDQEER